LVVVCASALIVNVDNTILNVALPTLVRKLAATASELQWIVDSYAMVFAGLLLVGGSLADRFGRKRFFLIGLTVFAAGSVGAAFSGSVDVLIGWRAVMGAGAALTIPRRCRSSTTCSATGPSGPGRLACGPGPSAWVSL
jgi:MFS family permease